MTTAEPERTGAAAASASEPAAMGERAQARGFQVRLDNFAGPFDLLLQLISKHKLDVTEVALSVVTDDFIAHLRALADDDYDLDETTEFLLIAATLLDLKAARLLPQGEVEDADDLELLEARDLLFARLLQYRAYKQMAGTFEEAMAAAPRRYPRSVALEERLAALLPDVLISLSPDDFAQLAAKAMTPRAEVEVAVEHLHLHEVSVREQANLLAGRLRVQGSATFRSLTADSPDVITTIARFLALLELFRAASITFDQASPLAELTIRWTGSASGDIEVADEFDGGAAPAPAEADQPPTATEPEPERAKESTHE